MPSCFSKLTLGYLVPLFKQGSIRPLTEEDVPSLPNNLSASTNVNRFEINWQKEIKQNKTHPSLLKVLFQTFGTHVWYVATISLLFVACVCSSPFFVNRLVRYFQGEAPQYLLQIPTGYFYAVGVWLCFAIVSFCVTHIYVNTTHMGHSARLGIINAIYRKSLRLSSAVGQSGGSGFVNLMTVDSERIWAGFLKMHILPNTILVVIIGCIELYITAGYSGLFGFLVIVCFVPVQSMVAKAISTSRRLMSNKTDLRVQLATEVLSSIRVVKSYGWEAALATKINDIRLKETAALRRLLILRAVNQVLTFIIPTFAMTVVFLIYSIEHPVNETVVFTSLAILSVVRPCILSLPKGVDIFAEFFVSVERIRLFLLLEEQQEDEHKDRNKDKNKDSNSKIEPTGTIQFQNASFSWSSQTNNDSDDEKNKKELFQLSNINLNISQGKFVCVVGSVGSGKTTLLLSMLGEMNRTHGEAAVAGRIAYAGQSPWIQNASIRNGILFSPQTESKTKSKTKAHIEEKYQMAIKASQLGPDLKSLVNGDGTIIGDRGVNLSGGQKQRIALGRCLQLASECDLFLFDDVLSAVDVDVAVSTKLSFCLSRSPLSKTPKQVFFNPYKYI